MIDVQVRAVSHRQMTVIGKCTPVEFQLRFDVTEIIYWFPLLRLGEVSREPCAQSYVYEHIASRSCTSWLGKQGDGVPSINLNAPNSSGPCRVNFIAINLFLPIAGQAFLNSIRDPRAHGSRHFRASKGLSRWSGLTVVVERISRKSNALNEGTRKEASRCCRERS